MGVDPAATTTGALLLPGQGEQGRHTRDPRRAGSIAHAGGRLCTCRAALQAQGAQPQPRPRVAALVGARERPPAVSCSSARSPLTDAPPRDSLHPYDCRSPRGNPKCPGCTAGSPPLVMRWAEHKQPLIPVVHGLGVPQRLKRVGRVGMRRKREEEGAAERGHFAQGQVS